MNTSSTTSTYPKELTINTSTGLETLTILSELGSGAYNNAFLASFKSNPDEHFVLKTYISGKENENFEPQILGMIRTRNVDSPIVKLIDPKISIENTHGHIEGLARGKKIQDQPPSPRQALELAIRFAKLLKTCAEVGVAYRDIKPSDHIFWEPDTNSDAVKTMTVIDWNIAQYQVSPDALYFDLTKFCRRLPEFFMAAPPKGGEYYHPLAWKYSNEMKAQISPALWLTLANLSFNFVAPIIPDSEILLAITSFTTESIIDAWNRIIETLCSVLESSKDQETRWGLKSLDKEYHTYLADWLKAPEMDTTARTNEFLYHWIGVGGIVNPLKVIKQSDTQELARLRLARFLNPGGIRETILLSLYVAIYRTGLVKDETASKHFRKILQGLLDGQHPSSIYEKDNFTKLAALAREKAQASGYVDAEKIHADIWETLAKEFEIWILCSRFEDEKDVRLRQGLAEELDRFHPFSSLLLKGFNELRRSMDLEIDIEKALEETNFDLATLLASSHKGIDSDGEADYLRTITLCRRLCESSKQPFSTVEEINRLLVDIKGRQLPPTYSSLAKVLEIQYSLLSLGSSLQHNLDEDTRLFRLQEIHQQIRDTQIGNPIINDAVTALSNRWQDEFRSYKTKVLTEPTDGLEKLSGSTRLERLRQLATVTDKLLAVSRECDERDLERELKQQKREYEYEIGEFDRQLKSDIDSFKDEHFQLLQSAGESPENYKAILRNLQDIGNGQLFSSSDKWLHDEKQKIELLIGAADLLQNLEHDKKREQDIDHAIKTLSAYPEGQKLEQKLTIFRDENVFRYQISKNIDNLSITQQQMSTSLDELDHQIRQAPQVVISTVEPRLNQISQEVIGTQESLDSLVAGMNERRHELNSLTEMLETRFKRIYWAAIVGALGIFCALMSLSLAVISDWKLDNKNPTASPTVVNYTATSAIVLPAETIEPTNTPAIPTLTITPEGKPPVIQEALLKTNAVFLMQDLKTQMWLFSNPSNLNTIKVQVLETASGYSHVRIKVLVGNSVLVNDGLPARISIRTEETWDGQADPPVIGISVSPITLEKVGDVMAEKWQPVYIDGWVDDKFIEALKSEQ